MRSWGSIALAAIATLGASRGARAEPPREGHVELSAGHLDLEPDRESVTLRDGVELRYDRYRVTADRIELRRDGDVIRFEGPARVAFCPCPRPPFTLVASGGRFDPGGDLVLRAPRIELYELPVFALPYLWIRGPDKVGLLPPLVAYRGADGLLLGTGVYLPYQTGFAELTAGGYTTGGVELGAKLVTPESSTRFVTDLVHGQRFEVDARGSLSSTRATDLGLAWRVDALRGDRALSGAVELGPAALPFDGASAEASAGRAAGTMGARASLGVVAAGARGQGEIAAGPRALGSFGGPIGRVGSWSASMGGALLGNAELVSASGALPIASPGALPLGRASASVEVDARPGPFELRASATGRGRVLGQVEGGAEAAREGAGAAGVELSLPFSRAFAGAAGDAPLVHWVAPVVALRGALLAEEGALFSLLDGALPGAAPPPLGSWMAAGGVSTALGRYGGPSLRLDARAGAAGSAEGAVALVHARLGFEARAFAGTTEVAAVGPGRPNLGAPTSAAPSGGVAVVGRARVGALAGPWARLELAGQAGEGAAEARAIAAGSWAAVPVELGGYLAASGLSGAAEVSIPWTRVVRTGARADADLTGGALLAVRGLLEARHPCGCFSAGLVVGHRLGREGVDAALTLDLIPPRPAR